MAVPLAHLIKVYYADKREGTTRSNISFVDQAIEQFYFANDAYPCPADPRLSEDDDDYGEPIVCGGGPNTEVGAVPFKALAMPSELTLDGHGHKLMYAVTRRLTNDATFDLGGNLNIQQNILDTSVSPAVIIFDNSIVTGHYFIFSTGRNGEGGFSAQGGSIADCITNADDEQVENENCDGDNVFLHWMNTNSGADSDDFYDDRSEFQTAAPTRLWMENEDDPNDIFSNTGLIGINTDEPEVALDVEGSIRTVGGNAHSAFFCIEDEEIDNCFETDLIMGGRETCQDIGVTSSAMSGISFGDIDCSIGISGVAGDCSSTFIMGIDAGGNFICAP